MSQNLEGEVVTERVLYHTASEVSKPAVDAAKGYNKLCDAFKCPDMRIELVQIELLKQRGMKPAWLKQAPCYVEMTVDARGYPHQHNYVEAPIVIDRIGKTQMSMQDGSKNDDNMRRVPLGKSMQDRARLDRSSVRGDLFDTVLSDSDRDMKIDRKIGDLTTRQPPVGKLKARPPPFKAAYMQ
jgi:hypothetical protein